jgi:hypothetical protein
LVEAPPVRLASSSQEVPILPPAAAVPFGPGLFLDDVEIREVGDLRPALADAPGVEGPLWDAALDEILGNEVTAPSLPPPSGLELGTEVLGAAGAGVLAGMAIALWGVTARDWRTGTAKNRSRSLPDNRDQTF